MGRGHYPNPQLPIHSHYMAGYAEPSGGHELVAGAYREAQYFGSAARCPLALRLKVPITL